MHVFVFEPRDIRRRMLEQELGAVGLSAHFVTDEFFNYGGSVMADAGLDDQAILIGENERTAPFVRAVRRSGFRNPLIVFHDTKEPEAVAALLNCGADDVVTSPFTGDEILSRIKSIMRRTHGHASESVTIGEVTAYFDGRDPLVSGTPIPLSKREHDIFHYLALKSDKIISKSSIYDAIYSMNTDQPFDKVIDVYICKLRKKIATAAESGCQYIQTIRGRGYKFSAPEDFPAVTSSYLPHGQNAPH